MKHLSGNFPFVYLAQESDSSDSENAAATDEDDEVKGLESDVEKHQGKASIASVSKSRKVQIYQSSSTFFDL